VSGPVTVVGIGADGWPGLPDASRAFLGTAEAILGGRRQLDLLPAEVAGERVAWPSPLIPALPGLLQAHAGRRVAVLASGDPMFFGIGTTLVRLLGPGGVRVLPHPSSVSLACARLGWPVEDTEVVSAVGRPLELLHPLLQPGRRVLVLSADAHTPEAVAALLAARGYAASPLTVLGDLGGPDERVSSSTSDASNLNLVAIEVVGASAPLLPPAPGLPDDAYEHDGQLTKRDVRAITLARLAPVPGQLLWDVGAGAGSIAIEWMRTHRACRAIAVEHRPDRVARIAANAAALGVPGLTVVPAAAPAALDGLEPPDAVFVGGGATVPGVIEASWAALRPGGRLVVNAVTIESETLVAGWFKRVGGELTRISIERAEPIAGSDRFTGWRPAMPVTQWVVTRS
jgi:precorrin-6B C5,15-methyltransferase / cobalt-precorrin-6B C5,C15-methyltransferase